MTADYLSKNATCTEACDWLKVQTGENWTLARMLEHGLMPWFWLDYKPGYPAIFGDHIEGYLAPMVFAGDTHRLEADGSNALVNLTRAHDGVVVKIEPGMTVPLKELRFKREELQALSSVAKKPAPEQKNPTHTKVKDERTEKSDQPWLVKDPRDPAPNMPWYTPARYLARQFVAEDPTLLRKRKILAAKVSKSLFDLDFKKRGGKSELDRDTVLKAFSNVILG